MLRTIPSAALPSGDIPVDLRRPEPPETLQPSGFSGQRWAALNLADPDRRRRRAKSVAPSRPAPGASNRIATTFGEQLARAQGPWPKGKRPPRRLRRWLRQALRRELIPVAEAVAILESRGDR
jgi:hypothetical protein